MGVKGWSSLIGGGSNGRGAQEVWTTLIGGGQNAKGRGLKFGPFTVKSKGINFISLILENLKI